MENHSDEVLEIRNKINDLQPAVEETERLMWNTIFRLLALGKNSEEIHAEVVKLETSEYLEWVQLHEQLRKATAPASSE